MFSTPLARERKYLRDGFEEVLFATICHTALIVEQLYRQVELLKGYQYLNFEGAHPGPDASAD